MKKIEFTEEEKIKIKKLYLEKKSCKEIAKMFNCSQTPIYCLLGNLGIQKNNPWNKNLTKEIDERVRKSAEESGRTLKMLYKEGKIINPKGMLGKENKWGHHTEKTKEILKIKNLGKHLSPKTEFKKCEHRNTETEFKKGQDAHNKIIFTKEQKKLIIDLFINKLKSVEEIGKILNCTSRPIYRILKENNIEINQGKRMSKKYSGKNNFNYIKLDDEKIISLYNKGLSTNKIGEIFSTNKTTILDRLKKNGIEIRSAGFKNREPLTSKDGHLVKSCPENEIDNFLFDNKIQHIYEGYIADSRYKYDFYLPEFNLYIEYWGIEDNEYYKNKINIKLQLYKELGLNILSIYPKDNINEKLKIILEAKKEGIKEIKII